MKKIFFLIGTIIFLTQNIIAQKDYKVVFDLNSIDTLDHKVILRWAGKLAKVSADATLEVVMYGQGA
jgi:hypothetical protein